MKTNEEIEITRIRNPFHDPLVTELIEDPILYSKMLSQKILVGETLQVFQPKNVILVGPQGSGKSMILNLIRYEVLSKWIHWRRKPPSPLKHLAPFFGISINLVRADFHAFGRRSVSRVVSGGQMDQNLDATCAADFLNHYLLREFLKGIKFLLSNEGSRSKDWMGIKSISLDYVTRTIASWDCWFGYYADCNSFDALLSKCEQRLSIRRSFLNANIDEIPKDIWKSKSTLGKPLHEVGNFLQSIIPKKKRLPLFVVIDQYEVLPELNPSFGTFLQRIVNTLIKARDPVVFYKIGARTYDWGTELRIWGAESRIEVQRDYIIINLADVLMRDEDAKGWLFPDFARDVAYKRIKVEGRYREVSEEQIEKIFGTWDPKREAELYFKDKSRIPIVLTKISNAVMRQIESICIKDSSPLDLRLAAAWALERQKRKVPESEIIAELQTYPWKKRWWWKERVEIALLQIASLANQKRRYFGWSTVIFLSGSNISNFLLLCSEIWDRATKLSIRPLDEYPLSPLIQSKGIFAASEQWLNRDKNEQIGGRKRFEVVTRLGTAIHESLIGDLAISNPGHSGFSLRETDLSGSEKGKIVAEFLQRAVSWAIFEERAHTSKFREAAIRRKWYLHPLLSPFFAIPYKRVKEPLYVNIDDVYNWVFGIEKVKFGSVELPSKTQNKSQLQISFRELK